MILIATAATSSAKKYKQRTQGNWRELLRKIEEHCRGWLIPQIQTLSYHLSISASPKLLGEARVFYRAPNLFRVETQVWENGTKTLYTFIFREGRLWRREGNQPFVDVAEEIRRHLGGKVTKVKGVGKLFEPLTFLRGVQVRFTLDEILENPEKCRVEAVEEVHECLKVTLTKPDEPFRGYMALGLQHFVRSFVTDLIGQRVTLWFHNRSLQPLTEIFLDEKSGGVSVVSYKDFRNEPAPKLVEIVSVVDGWTWVMRLEFEWWAKKAWVLKQGEGWGEFLEPGLMKAVAKVSDVRVNAPLPEDLFKPS